jgi:cytochrome c-type biogenesis protein CcmH
LLLTVVAAQLNDREVALANFALIKDQLSANSSLYQSLVSQLRAMGAPEELLLLDSNFSNEVAGESTTSLSGSIPSNADIANDAGKQQSADRGFDITVSIASELESKLPASGFLIVFAQDAISGSRVPLAVKKMALPQFPISVTLSADDAMIASLSLKTAEQVTLTARISVDEDVMTSAGELQGSLVNVQVNDSMQAVTIIINEEVQ